MTEDEGEEVSNILKTVFAAKVADSCLSGGWEGFVRYVAPANLAARQKEGCEVWLVKESGRTAAIAELAPPAHITLLFVLPDYQGRGVGRYLFEHLLTRIRERNSDNAEVQVTVNSVPQAKGFYEGMGFEAASEEIYVEGIPTVPMVLKLNPHAGT